MKSPPLKLRIFSALWELFYLNTFANALDSLQVNLRNGTIEGFRFDLSHNSASGFVKQANIFLGIPYAKAPVGNLRLQKPQPALNWTGVRDATAFGAPCIPVHFLTASGYAEDCLFLNVFQPVETYRNKSTIKRYPVLVFIHGGGFNVGGNFIERYENISSNFVSHGIVVVTIQYRLGFFGFFSDGTSDFPGNYGLWDQRQALLWVQDNIDAFGGDPTRVTLWGQSAGSASVSMLSLSRHTRHLFQQTIQQSGSILSPWALNNDVVYFSRELISEMGCLHSNERSDDITFDMLENTNEEEHDEDFKKANMGKYSYRACLQALQHEDILFALSTKELIRGEFNMVVFNPRWDSDFFDVDLIKAIRHGSKRPSIIGFNSHEAAFLTLDYGGSVYGFRGPMTIEEPEKFNSDDLVNFVNEKIHSLTNRTILDSEERKFRFLRNQIATFYKKSNNNDILDFHFYMKQYTLLLSDIMFIIPILWEARRKAQSGWPIYLFQNDYSNPKMFKNKPFKAITHGAEYPYTLGVHIFGNFEFNEEDKQLRRFLVTSIANFVKRGNPSTEATFWPVMFSTTKSEKRAHNAFKVLSIHNSTPRIETGLKDVDKRLRFWDTLSRKLNFARIAGLPTFRKKN